MSLNHLMNFYCSESATTHQAIKFYSNRKIDSDLKLESFESIKCAN